MTRKNKYDIVSDVVYLLVKLKGGEYELNTKTVAPKPRKLHLTASLFTILVLLVLGLLTLQLYPVFYKVKTSWKEIEFAMEHQKIVATTRVAYDQQYARLQSEFIKPAIGQGFLPAVYAAESSPIASPTPSLVEQVRAKIEAKK